MNNGTTQAMSANRQKDVALMTVMSTRPHFDNTTLCCVLISLLWVVLAGRESKTACRVVAEGLFWVIVCDYAGVHLAWGMHPQTHETSKLCRDEYQRQADG